MPRPDDLFALRCRRIAPRNFGERSLRKAVDEYVEHYHHERNHQGLDNLIPFPYAGETKGRSGSVVKFERLGGLLNYYHREKGEEERLAG